MLKINNKFIIITIILIKVIKACYMFNRIVYLLLNKIYSKGFLELREIREK